MGWITTESPLPHIEIHHCDKQGCGALARIHFLSVSERLERRFARRCDDHADEIRSTIQKKHAPIAPAAPVQQQAIDPTAAALEPKPAEKPKRPPQRWTIPDGAMPTTCGSCGDAVHWIVTAAHRRMPINAFGELAGASHFINCANADQHRRKR